MQGCLCVLHGLCEGLPSTHRLFTHPLLGQSSRVSHTLCSFLSSYLDFPGDSVVKSLSANAGEMGFNPCIWTSPWRGNGNLLQYFAWEISWAEESDRPQSMVSKKSLTQLSD